MTPKRCANGGSDGGDFVFRLKGSNVEVFVPGKFMQNVARRRNRVAPVKERFSGKFGRSDKPESRSLISRDLPVQPRRKFGRRYAVMRGENFRGFAEVIARLHRTAVGLGDVRKFTEFVV